MKEEKKIQKLFRMNGNVKWKYIRESAWLDRTKKMLRFLYEMDNCIQFDLLGLY